MKITYETAARTPQGKAVIRFVLQNEVGTVIELTNWGARWMRALMPDCHGHAADVLVGYDRTAYLREPDQSCLLQSERYKAEGDLSLAPYSCLTYIGDHGAVHPHGAESRRGVNSVRLHHPLNR